ncbi:MAG: hypothetical protein JWN98_2606 [Abditibacteriota bacterium]|nr:hypothetical protein [Abditibacteriota bacterium]
MNESQTVSPSAELEVPGEPGVYWCARHRKTQTRLRCGRCETPICPKCTRMGPIGARCPACSSSRSSHIYQITPIQYVLAAATAIILGSLCGWFVRGALLGIFVMFYAPVAGTLIGKAVSFVTRNKRGTPLAFIASAGIVLGALIPLDGSIAVLLTLMQQNASPEPGGSAFTPMLRSASSLGVWIYLLFAVPSAWMWLK